MDINANEIATVLKEKIKNYYKIMPYNMKI